MSWNVNIPIKDGKVVAEEVTFSGTLPGGAEIKVHGHSQEGPGGYTSLGVTADGLTAYSSVAAKTNV